MKKPLHPVATGLGASVPIGFYLASAFNSTFMGVLVGGVLGAVVGGVQWQRLNAAKRARATYEPEGLLRDAQAVRMLKPTPCHGWLFLTKQRVAFAPTEGDRYRVELALGDIDSVKVIESLTKTQLEVTGKNGEKHAFSLVERELWVIAIEQAKARATGTTITDA